MALLSKSWHIFEKNLKTLFLDYQTTTYYLSVVYVEDKDNLNQDFLIFSIKKLQAKMILPS
jgi:hypothetical protein